MCNMKMGNSVKDVYGILKYFLFYYCEKFLQQLLTFNLFSHKGSHSGIVDPHPTQTRSQQGETFLLPCCTC